MDRQVVLELGAWGASPSSRRVQQTLGTSFPGLASSLSQHKKLRTAPGELPVCSPHSHLESAQLPLAREPNGSICFPSHELVLTIPVM